MDNLQNDRKLDIIIPVIILFGAINIKLVKRIAKKIGTTPARGLIPLWVWAG